MHEYIEVQFRRRDKPFRLRRQVSGGFEFDESDPPTRAIDLGFRAFDDGTKYRMAHIRQIKGWQPEEFKLRVSVEDGSIIIRGDDEYALPEGFYNVTANVEGARLKRLPKRVELKHDDHGVVTIDLELDERTIEVKLTNADDRILSVLSASILNGESGDRWVEDTEIRPTKRACVLNLLASLRAFPTTSTPLLSDVDILFRSFDERSYARVRPSFSDRVAALAEEHDKVYPEGQPKADIHNLLIQAIWDYDANAKDVFDTKGLLSFRAEGSPSLQMVIATTKKTFDSRFVDLDLDLGNPLQDLAGLVVHMGELLNGKPTNHLDLRKKLANGKAAQYLYYTVRGATEG